MLLGVIREAGELDSGASPVTAAPETAGPSFVGSVCMERSTVGFTFTEFSIINKEKMKKMSMKKML